MLAHPGPQDAAAHEALVLTSLEAGVVDLHALTRARLSALERAGPWPREAQRPLWALRRLTPACFSAREVHLRATPSPSPHPEWLEMPGDVARLSTHVGFRDALAIIDAWVALASARAAPTNKKSSEALAPMSVRERATWRAALHSEAWPRLCVDAAFSPAQASARGRARAHAVDRFLRASAGACGEPRGRSVVVYVGARGLSDGLSPYVHDVGFALAQAAPAALASRSMPLPRMADAYDLADAVVTLDVEVEAERAAVEAEVGIESMVDAKGEWIDARAVALDACHADFVALARWARAADTTLLRLAWDPVTPGLEAAALLEALCSSVSIDGAAIGWPTAEGSWRDGEQLHLYTPPSGATHGLRHAPPREVVSLPLPIHVDSRALLHALGRCVSPSRVVWGAEDEGAPIGSSRALAAYAARVWCERDA